MDAELKSILTVLLDKVERIESTLPTLATKDDVANLDARVSRLEKTMSEFGEEQRQMKEMIGVLRMREIGRLDGRIDQLTLEVGLGRKPAAL
ncbi:hypothetical protein [Roseomonas genomospecies 6]|uniref:Uncharacterized protein n=1 Tax=Roseomonas genomospecies 6 TaxID=214106 RepID=A0A9W7NN09_9PROT|nr:hypothetical protein [Roseomonas genomospecies 6]KAA0683442.1 hypothetical protein DS843_03350 [Roseomonas genomospecies 6]